MVDMVVSLKNLSEYGECSNISRVGEIMWSTVGVCSFLFTVLSLNRVIEALRRWTAYDGKSVVSLSAGSMLFTRNAVVLEVEYIRNYSVVKPIVIAT